jgi:hypothetical protein
MLTDALNSDLYPEWLEYIESDEARDAFCLIVGLAASVRGYSCHPGLHGVYRDFRFIDQCGDQPFAFGVAKNWLLFYFRAPATRSGRYSFEEVKASFPSANQPGETEWTVKLKNTGDVHALWKYLQLT